jgi:hypothetical protein
MVEVLMLQHPLMVLAVVVEREQLVEMELELLVVMVELVQMYQTFSVNLVQQLI